MCVMNGARIIRMHNIIESAHAIGMLEAAMGWREPAYLKHNMGDVNAPAHPERLGVSIEVEPAPVLNVES